MSDDGGPCEEHCLKVFWYCTLDFGRGQYCLVLYHNVHAITQYCIESPVAGTAHLYQCDTQPYIMLTQLTNRSWVGLNVSTQQQQENQHHHHHTPPDTGEEMETQATWSVTDTEVG